AGIKSAGVLLLSGLAMALAFAARRHRLAWPFLWPGVLVFSSAPGLMRMLTVRPHVASMGLTVLLLSLLVRGALWQILAVSAALAFCHVTFVWMVPLVAATTAVVRACHRRGWSWKEPAAALVGALLGGLLRPNPAGAARLLWVQLVTLAVEK